MGQNKNKTFISLGIIAVVMAIVFPLTIHFAKKVPDAIHIKNEDDFYSINNDLNGYYVLDGIINFTKPITPIGDKDHPFTGKFDCASPISGFSLNNVVIDLNLLDLDKYTIDNKTFIGIFPFNEGTIIHSVFNGIKYVNFDYSGCNDLFIGGLTGLNKGKITSNTIFQISGIEFSSKYNITFGGCAALNMGEIRRNKYVKHFECYVTCNNFSIGEFAGQCCENSIVELCSVASSIHIHNIDSKIDSINVGLICGIFDGGIIQNSIFNNSSINIMDTNIIETNCGGIVGLVTGSHKHVIKDCYFNGNVISNGIDLQSSSLINGCTVLSDVTFENLLIGGSLTSNNIKTGILNFADVFVKTNKAITNCYLLDTLKIPDSCVKNIENTININDVSVKKMKWNDGVWEISEGKIKFKGLDNEK